MPALVFPNRDIEECIDYDLEQAEPIVTQENANEFVTKIGRSNEQTNENHIMQEFLMCKRIVDILKQSFDPFDLQVSPGFFPSQYVKVDFANYLIDYDSDAQDLYTHCKRWYESASKSGTVEFLQLKVYNFSFDNFRPQKLLNDFFRRRLFYQALEKLETLHRHNIFHLDIKPGNLAVLHQESVYSYNIYFNDWDFAFIGSDLKSYETQYKYILTKSNRLAYYFENLPYDLYTILAKNENKFRLNLPLSVTMDSELEKVASIPDLASSVEDSDEKKRIKFEEKRIRFEKEIELAKDKLARSDLKNFFKQSIYNKTVFKSNFRDFLMYIDIFHLVCAFLFIFRKQTKEFIFQFMVEYVSKVNAPKNTETYSVSRKKRPYE